MQLQILAPQPLRHSSLPTTTSHTPSTPSSTPSPRLSPSHSHSRGRSLSSFSGPKEALDEFFSIWSSSNTGSRSPTTVLLPRVGSRTPGSNGRRSAGGQRAGNGLSRRRSLTAATKGDREMVEMGIGRPKSVGNGMMKAPHTLPSSLPWSRPTNEPLSPPPRYLTRNPFASYFMRSSTVSPPHQSDSLLDYGKLAGKLVELGVVDGRRAVSADAVLRGEKDEDDGS